MSSLSLFLLFSFPFVCLAQHVLHGGVVTANAVTTINIDTAALYKTVNNRQDAIFRVRLYNSVANLPVCTILNGVSPLTETLLFTVPADVGPAGAYYAFAIDSPGGPEADPGYVAAQISEYYNNTFSSIFFLESSPQEASGWSDYEKTLRFDGGQQTGSLLLYGDTGSIPCEAYNCMRTCVEQFTWPLGQWNNPSQAVYDAAYLQCAKLQCGVPGPIFPITTGDPTNPPISLPEPPIIDPACDPANGLTACGASCCGAGALCLPFGTCVGP